MCAIDRDELRRPGLSGAGGGKPLFVATGLGSTAAAGVGCCVGIGVFLSVTGKTIVFVGGAFISRASRGSGLADCCFAGAPFATAGVAESGFKTGFVVGLVIGLAFDSLLARLLPFEAVFGIVFGTGF